MSDAQTMTSTKFHSAEEKDKVLAKLKRFIEAGFRHTMFTKLMYSYVSNMYGHIAHFNQGGYYDTWFHLLPDRIEWLERAAGWTIYGDPEYCFSDVERALAEWIRKGDALDKLRAELAQQVEATERAHLAHLSSKYGTA